MRELADSKRRNCDYLLRRGGETETHTAYENMHWWGPTAAVTARDVLTAFVAPFVALSTAASFWSALLAAIAVLSRQPRAELAAAVNYGIGIGFIIGVPIATIALAVELP